GIELDPPAMDRSIQIDQQHGSAEYVSSESRHQIATVLHDVRYPYPASAIVAQDQPPRPNDARIARRRWQRIRLGEHRDALRDRKNDVSADDVPARWHLRQDEPKRQLLAWRRCRDTQPDAILAVRLEPCRRRRDNGVRTRLE